MKVFIAAVLLAISALAQNRLVGIHTLYIEKLPNDLDQYLRAEFFKQTRGSIAITTDRAEADAILTGVSQEETGALKQVTGRYLGLHDNATASLSLMDRDGKTILWADEAGDRSLFFGSIRRGGERKVAERLVSKLRKVLAQAK